LSVYDPLALTDEAESRLHVAAVTAPELEPIDVFEKKYPELNALLNEYTCVLVGELVQFRVMNPIGTPVRDMIDTG
jgi:hypothetical protein